MGSCVRLVVLEGTSLVVSARLRGEVKVVTTSRVMEEGQVPTSREEKFPIRVDLSTSCVH